MNSTVVDTVGTSPHQNGDDAFELLLHQVADDLVVEILHRLPLHHGKKQKLNHTIFLALQHTQDQICPFKEVYVREVRNPDTPTDMWTHLHHQ